MAGKTRRIRGPREARPFDWALLSAMAIIGGTSFAMIRVAVETIPPSVIAVSRLWIGAGIMYAVMRIAGRRFPPLLVRRPRGTRLHLAWTYILSVSLVGYAIPFYIFPWAQQYVESGLAGVYMAFMPIWTLALAYLFASEGLNARKLLGFALGFLGVMILLGPEVISGAARSSVFAQAGILLATFCYAATAVIMRRAPAIRPRVFAAGAVLGGAVILTPTLLLADFAPAYWSTASLLAIIGLGAGPTGLAGLLIIIMIKRVGAGFMSLANYLTPVIAVIVGAIAFHERLEPHVFAALAIILLGVGLSQQKRKPQAASTSGVISELQPASAEACGDQIKS